MKTPDLLANPQFRIFIENFATLSRASQQLSFQEARKRAQSFFLLLELFLKRLNVLKM